MKTDRRDAKLIAPAMRGGLYRAVHVKSAAAHKLRQALTSRGVVLRLARQLQGKIRGDLKVFGIKLGRVGSGGFAVRVKACLADHDDLWALIAPLLELRQALLTQVRRYDGQLWRLPRHHQGRRASNSQTSPHTARAVSTTSRSLAIS